MRMCMAANLRNLHWIEDGHGLPFQYNPHPVLHLCVFRITIIQIFSLSLWSSKKHIWLYRHTYHLSDHTIWILKFIVSFCLINYSHDTLMSVLSLLMVLSKVSWQCLWNLNFFAFSFLINSSRDPLMSILGLLMISIGLSMGINRVVYEMGCSLFPWTIYSRIQRIRAKGVKEHCQKRYQVKQKGRN